jgi:hypothetical protein
MYTWPFCNLHLLQTVPLRALLVFVEDLPATAALLLSLPLGSEGGRMPLVTLCLTLEFQTDVPGTVDLEVLFRCTDLQTP